VKLLDTLAEPLKHFDCNGVHARGRCIGNSHNTVVGSTAKAPLKVVEVEALTLVALMGFESGVTTGSAPSGTVVLG
jgi:hypothetical protein